MGLVEVAMAVVLSATPFTAGERAKLRATVGEISEQCTRALGSFPEVRIVGAFAYDRGCIDRGYVFKGAVYADLKRASPVLGGAFSHGGEKEKRAAALAWTREALLQGRALDAEPSGFQAASGPAFSAPNASLLPDGGVKIDLWARAPSGMRPQEVYTHRSVRFDAAGDVTDLETLATVTRPLG